jgi:fluoride exporter
MKIYLWIGLGSALGGMARYGCSGLVARLLGETLPWGTILVNVIGSFVIGLFGTLVAPDGRLMVSPAARHFVMLGLLGGFTTFSSFSWQTLALTRDGQWLRAGGNVFGSVVLCLAAVWLGHVSAVSLNQLR